MRQGRLVLPLLLMSMIGCNQRDHTDPPAKMVADADCVAWTVVPPDELFVGEEGSFTVFLTNVSEREIACSAATAGCGCTSLVFESQILAPGATCSVTGVVSRVPLGQSQVSTTILLGDTSTVIATIPLHVLPRVIATPTVAILRPEPGRGGLCTTKLSFENTCDEPLDLAVASVEIAAKEFVVQPASLKVGPGESAVFEIACSNDQIATVCGELRWYSLGGTSNAVTVPVTVEPTRGLRIIPATVYLGYITTLPSPDDPVATVRVCGAGVEDWVLTSINSPEFLSVTCDPLVVTSPFGEKGWNLTVCFAPNALPPTALASTITLHLKSALDRGSVSVEVPVRGVYGEDKGR